MEFKSLQRIPQLDGVRGIAILLVVIYHYIVITTHFPPDSLQNRAIECFRLAWTGVDLFFVLSGFLIGGILIDNRQSINLFSTFYRRRVYRIFPLYYTWLMIYLALLATNFSMLYGKLHWVLSGTDLIWSSSYFVFLQNVVVAVRNDFGPNWMGVTWSLAVEEQFYVIFPIMVRYIRPSKLIPALLATIFIVPFLRIATLLLWPENQASVYVLMPLRADSLLLGVLAAWMVRHRGISRMLINNTKSLYVAFFILFILLLPFASKWKYSSTSWFGMAAVGYSLIALFYAVLILIAVTEGRGLITRITLLPLLRHLGRIGYGVYIVHQAMLYLLHGLILNQLPIIANTRDLVVTGIALALTIFVTTLSWNYYELPFVSAGRRYKYIFRDRSV